MKPVSASPDTEQFRKVMGSVPTAVTVVAGLDAEGGARGVTIGSFVSISLDPTLVGFFIGAQSRTWPVIADAGHFCVNVLAKDQEELCWRFAGEDGHRFDGLDWSMSPGGSPLLAGAVAWVDCEVHSTVAVGDHDLVVGRVTAMGSAEPERTPMVFHRGRIAGVGDAR